MIKKQMDRLDAGIKEAGEKVNRWKEALLAESRAEAPNKQTIHELQLKLEHAQGLLQGLELAKYVIGMGLDGLTRDIDAQAAIYNLEGQSTKANAIMKVYHHIKEGKPL